MIKGSKKYKGIPIYAAPGLHKDCFGIINRILQPDAKIFDIAAGAGAFVTRLKDAGYYVYANDIDLKDWKAKNIPKTSIDLNNALEDFPSMDVYDLVVAMEIIEHLQNPRKLLMDCKKLTKPDGYILISTPNVTDMVSRVKYLRKGMFYHFSPDSFLQTGHMTILPCWLLEILIASVGLEIISFKFSGKKEKNRNVKGLFFMLAVKFLRLFMKYSHQDELSGNYIIYLLRKKKH